MQNNLSANSFELLDSISLHDVRIRLIEFDVKAKCLTITVADLYACYTETSEYKGPLPCSLKFENVKEVSIDIGTKEGVRITEARVVKNSSDFKLELDLNLGGGARSEGRNSVWAKFEKLKIEEFSSI